MALKYPTKLDGKYNYIRFTALDSNNNIVDSVVLYSPPNLNFADSASYNQFDMGVLGASQFQSTVDAAMGGSGSDAIRSLGTNFDKAAGQSSAMNNIIGAQVLQNAGLGSGVVEKAKDIYLQRAGKAINPNSVTQFTNTTIRNFSFTWKMMAENSSESNAMKQIVEFFRNNMYPDSDAGGLLLSYPSKFRIKFMTPQGENRFIPRIFESYLINLSTVYNATSNIYFDGGAPSELDLTVSFQETKALTRQDLNKLESGATE